MISRAIGIDVAWYETYFRPEQATRKVDFGIMKLTEGTSYVDPSAPVMWQGLKQLPVKGAYHYQRSGMSWQAQADNYLREAAKYDLDFHVLDFEKIGNVMDKTMAADCRRIVDYWKTRSKLPILIYSNLDVYDNYLFPLMTQVYPTSGAKWLDDQLFWVAQWISQIVPGDEWQPRLPRNRKPGSWTFWQTSEVGNRYDYGTGGAVDTDIYNGTREQMIAQFAGTYPVPDPDPIPTTPTPERRVWDGVVIAGAINVRSGPLVSMETYTGQYVKTGEEFYGQLWVGNGYVWMKIIQAYTTSLIGKWVAVRKEDGSDILIKLFGLYVMKKDWKRTSDGLDRRHSIDYFGMKDYGAAFAPPDQVNYYDDEWVTLHSAAQWLWFGACVRATYHKDYGQLTPTQKNEAENWWTSLVDGGRCYTNGTGPDDGFQDFITGANPGATPIQIETVLCSGVKPNIVKVIGSAVMKSAKYPGTHDKPMALLHYPVEAIDIREPMPTVDRLLMYPHLWQQPNISYGVGKSDVFPQFDGNSIVPNFSNDGVNYLRSDWVEPYEV